MGAERASADEAPEHVVVVSAFLIDRCPVTNREYREFVLDVGHQPPPHWKGGEYPLGRDEHPVVYVSWYDAAAYAAWAGKRLPSEEEWEKAARGTDARRYPWGQEFSSQMCNTILRLTDRTFRTLQERSKWLAAWRASPEGRSVIEQGGHTTAVQTFPDGASPYGCLDVAGNVWEWTASWYQAYEGNAAPSPRFGAKYRTARGGSWKSSGQSARCSARNPCDPSSRLSFIGFRCAKDASGRKATQ